MQYSVQGLNCDHPERKDLLMDIGTEELSHLEVVGALARMHLRPMKTDRNAAHADPLIAIAGGGGVNLINSMGDAWTADYLKITGELDVDLRSNIAAEARAKIVYERLINFTDDPGTIDTLQFLMSREITHMKAFTAALESMGKPAFSIGRIPPTPGLVNQYFNDSTGIGDRGEPDVRGPWNEGDDWNSSMRPPFKLWKPIRLDGDRRMAARGEMDGRSPMAASPKPSGSRLGRQRRVSGSQIPDERKNYMPQLKELLIDELQDLLHAENQLVAALPKMANAAHNPKLKEAFQKHLEQTQAQVERLNEAFELLGEEASAKPCKAMAGLVQEGQETIEEGKDKEEIAADLALITAAQKVEHYEISSYGTVRTLARQIGELEVASLLSHTLGEEESADYLLTEVAKPLLQEATLEELEGSHRLTQHGSR
jgi:Mn-containing catalase